MTTLAEIQKAFIAALTDKERVDALNITNSKLFYVYRNSIISKHTAAIKKAYPVLLQLVGEDFFKTATYFYMQSLPSTNNNFNLYGNSFSLFLKSYLPAKKLPYLAEVAELEWAYYLMHYAANSEAFDLTALSAIPVSAYADIVFSLQPSCQLLKFEHSIYELWQTCQAVTELDSIELKSKEQYLMILSNNNHITIDKLTEAEFILLTQFSKGATLQEASQAVFDMDSSFDLTTCLQNFILKKYISGFKVLKNNPTNNGSL